MMLTALIFFAVATLVLAALFVRELLKVQKLNSEIKYLNQLRESEQSLLAQSKSSLQDAFKSLASTALEGNNKQFLDLAKSVLDKEKMSSSHDLEKRQKAVDDLVKPLSETLQRYQTQISELEKERQKSYHKVEGELERIALTNKELTQATSALKDSLKKPHVRGRWGEMQLKNCIELSGMSEYADVVFQDVQTDTEGQRLIPDMTVKMPGGRLVLVDAKTPIDAFLAYLDAPTEEQRKLEWIRHGKHIKDHINKLSLKDYSTRFANSADFTVMFLPNESFLYAALESQPDLIEYAMSKKILVATPPTFIGLLKVISYGWNEEKLARNAQQISEVGIELHKRVADFVEGFVHLGECLTKAKDEYDAAKTRLNSRVLVQARKLEKLGTKSAKEIAINEDPELIEP